MSARSLHTPWSLDCGALVMDREIVATRIAPEAATREDVRAIHALIAASPILALSLIRLIAAVELLPPSVALVDAHISAQNALRNAGIDPYCADTLKLLGGMSL